MKTAKALGFKKGDCVIIGSTHTAFPSSCFVGVLVSDVHTSTPCCEVWGLAHEAGSVYAHEIVKVGPEVIKASQYYQNDPHPFMKVAKEALGV